MKYPFQPRSTSYIEQGQFWAVPIGINKFSAGVVLALRSSNGKTDSRAFLAGLLDWSGDALPTKEDLIACSVLHKGFAHIKTITETGGEILGKTDPSWGIPESVEYTDSILTWGYNSIVKKACKAFSSS
ncbi:hypothetical protein H5162_20955 [Pseudoalteromonas sp. SR41-8]|uniref:hypothetical protein n=1 Tax=Pseudoalteromonas sp. SR41-8 TaxID=2760946 RepID=UPI001600C3E5|nr:hypothetical protein [Pseudoalteromonas sp. SR41-8]MBB1311880.1 hypothetical protein [Pseudoalteromonas sp. SR41-8]